MSSSKNQNFDISKIIELSLKLGLLIILIAWCFQIIRPFIDIILWGIIIAITLYPAYNRLLLRFKLSKKITAGIITLILLAVLIVPTVLLADSMTVGIKTFSSDLDSKNLGIPPPPDDVATWPIIGKSLHTTWTSASENLGDLANKYETQLLAAGNWLLNALLGTGLSFLQLILSTIISGTLLANSEPLSNASKTIFKKLIGEKSDDFARATEVTIRNVSKGVIGVSIIQSIVLGLIFIVAGVPYAGLWALLCLILSVIQVGTMPISVPVIIYLFISTTPLAAIIWTIFILAGSLLDNVLKPILMGKGAPAPMLVIFLGSIGGFMMSGFIGLFLGAIVLSLSYKLYLIWIEEEKAK